jgi:glycosyltransferase involved in cell wall biosynthesis
MRIAYVADGRSPISRSWIRHFTEAGHDVHLISTFNCEPLSGLATLQFVPVAFSRARREATGDGKAGGGGPARRILGVHFRTWLRDWLGPLTVGSASRKVAVLLEAIEPDLVHALRIPFEGILAANSRPTAPLLISSWGNDFTLHAAGNPLLGRLTREAMQRADGLHADCQRDLRLAWKWGFPRNHLHIVLPGAGGVRRDVFYPDRSEASSTAASKGSLLAEIPDGTPVVVNPRGLRAYIRNDTFFRAVPLILQRHPDATFLCPAMGGAAEAQSWVSRLGVAAHVKLLPTLAPQVMAEVFRRADVAVSPSEHDGTPNTLLEAMACGCFPIAGDLESVREWIEPGVNGMLVDPADPLGLARAVSDALDNEALRSDAARRNQQTITNRADYGRVMASAEAFYRQLLP